MNFGQFGPIYAFTDDLDCIDQNLDNFSEKLLIGGFEPSSSTHLANRLPLMRSAVVKSREYCQDNNLLI
jgi:hypothetical protein